MLLLLMTAAIQDPVVPDADEDVIEVIGTRSDQAQKIDRRTYRVQDTPSSAQKDTYQLLRGLPAVTVSPDDQISLLGASGVTVQVDGRAYNGDLRTLHGSDIERIEVITNPSAQYSADGTGGIINLVLRKVRGDGVTGNASVEGSTIGAVRASGTLKVKRGKTTIEVSPDFNGGVFSRSTYHKRRTIRDGAGGAISNRDDGGGRSSNLGFGTNFKVTREVTERTSLSASVYAGRGRYSARNHSDVVGLSGGFDSYVQDQRDHGANTFLAATLSADRKGKREGETLGASLNAFTNMGARNVLDVGIDDGSGFTAERRDDFLFLQNKVDWQHPIGTKQILSLGSDAILKVSHPRYAFEERGVAGERVSDEYRGRQASLAAYVTFQQKLGDWTVMPGLRVETTDRRVTSPGREEVRVRRTHLFPTVHLERVLGKSLTMTASYSRRIERPGLESLRPYAVRQDTLSLARGNPALRDMMTDAYEVNLHYRRKKLDVGLVVYDRTTDNVIRAAYSVDDEGRNVSMPVNAGTRRDRGAQFDVSSPLVARVKGMISVNLFQSREPVELGSDRTESLFRYTSDLTLDYNAPAANGRSGDVAQLTWHYESPSQQFQTRRRAWHSLSLSYTHSLNPKLAVTLLGETNPLGYGHRLDAPLVDEDYRVKYRPTAKIKLVRTFGKK